MKSMRAQTRRSCVCTNDNKRNESTIHHQRTLIPGRVRKGVGIDNTFPSLISSVKYRQKILHHHAQSLKLHIHCDPKSMCIASTPPLAYLLNAPFYNRSTVKIRKKFVYVSHPRILIQLYKYRPLSAHNKG